MFVGKGIFWAVAVGGGGSKLSLGKVIREFWLTGLFSGKFKEGIVVPLVDLFWSKEKI